MRGRAPGLYSASRGPCAVAVSIEARVWERVALGCGCAGGEAGRRAGAGETAMAGAAGTAAVGVNTVHLPARESKASGGQPGGRRDESLAGGRRGPWRSPAASRKDRPSLGEPERSPLRGYLLELSPSMVSVRRDLGRAGVFGASEWCRGLGDLWVRCVSVWVSCGRVSRYLQDLVSALRV